MQYILGLGRGKNTASDQDCLATHQPWVFPETHRVTGRGTGPRGMAGERVGEEPAGRRQAPKTCRLLFVLSDVTYIVELKDEIINNF